jgi:hypothetical protein
MLPESFKVNSSDSKTARVEVHKITPGSVDVPTFHRAERYFIKVGPQPYPGGNRLFPGAITVGVTCRALGTQ